MGSTGSKHRILSELANYTGTWSKQQASHLVRRTHFSLKVNQLNYIRSFSDANSAVEALVQNAKSTPLPDDPQWYTSSLSGSIQHMYDIQFRWMDSMYNGAFLNRMILFWSNFFAVSYNNMNALPDKASGSYVSHMYKYWKLLHQYSLGNFRDFLTAMCKNSAMVYYLNNYNNRAGQPNEDFARELMELFTMGPENKNGNANYTEEDVKEMARAVTGWRVNDNTISAYFDESRFDSGTKTIFGQSGNFDLDDVIDLIFTYRREETAWFLCRKLYVFYVSAEPDQQVIEQLADYCLDQNFDLSAVVSNLLSSAHFYEDRFMGCRIKSPIEIFIGYMRELEITPGSQIKEFIRQKMQESNEELLRPDTVFGWDGYNPPYSDGTPGHYAWINTNLMPSRWDHLNDIVYGYDSTGNPYDPIDLVEKISNPSDPFAVAEDIAEHILAVPLDRVGIRVVEEDFAGNPNLAPDLSSFPDYKVNLAKILLGNIPWYEWTANTDQNGSLYYQDTFAENLRLYISYLQQLPAYQLI